VNVQLGGPSAPQLAAFGATAQADGLSLSTATKNYESSVSTLLNSRYGVGSISVTGGGVIETDDNRYSDSSPFWGGDKIYPAGQTWACTGGFNIIGNSLGHHFMLTAGHCGESQWYANVSHSVYIGAVSSVYLYDGGPDFETIGTSTQGYVYMESDNGDEVVGQEVPAIGAEITYDGSISQEQSGIVSATNACDDFDDGGVVEETCYLVQSHPVAGQLCQSGDSGGPVFYKETGSTILAIGTIVGGNASLCSAEMIGVELELANSHLELYDE
jgi:hypothetical protein